MEGTRRPTRTVEGNLKGKSYAGQSGEKIHVHNGLRMLPDIAGCPTYGLKGQFNEIELALFRQRSLESRLAPAARGQYWTTPAAGYDKVDRHHIEMTPVSMCKTWPTKTALKAFDQLLKCGYQGTYHHFSKKRLDRYLSEFAARHNVREANTVDQMRGPVAHTVGKRLMYRDLVA